MINIDDKLSKFFTAAGFSLIAYSYYDINQLKYKELEFLNSSTGLNKNVKELLISYSSDTLKIFYLGVVITFFGIIFWIREYNSNPKKQNEKTFYCCQSCGKLFSSMRMHGKNLNNEVNNSFCFECYENGMFTNVNLKIEDLLTDENKAKYNKNWFRISLEKHLKSLERWKEIEY